MALTRIKRGPAPNVLKAHRQRQRTEQPRSTGLETLTAGALYDIGLHSGSLTAAALDVTAGNAMDVRRLIQPWQARAMSYYDLVPEVKFAAQFMSQMLRKVRLYPARLDPDTQEPEEITSGPEYDIFNRIIDRNGGRAELQGSYGKLRFLIGECYLTVSPDRDRGEVWECLSPGELRVQPGGLATRFRAPMLSADQYLIGRMEDESEDGAVTKYKIGNAAQTIAANGGAPLGPQFSDSGPDVIVVYRLWRPSPGYTWLADCSMQASVDILEELVLSTYSVRAQLKSRLNTVGILPLPEEISFPSLGNDPNEDPTSDTFNARLQGAVLAAIKDPGTAAAASPIILQMAGEYIDKIKLVRFNDNQGDLVEVTRRAEMIERFGVGAELPPDLFKSSESINHWNIWMVDEQTWKSYGHPAALEMASDFNAAYLQPQARADGVTDWESLVVGIDPSEVINHPNRGADAKALYEARCIGKIPYLEALGYNENDLPPEDELNEMIGVAIRDGSYARYGIPAVRANIEPNAGDIESAQGGASTVVQNPTTGSESEPGPPTTGPGAEGTQGGPALTASARDAQLLATCQAAVHRGREMAGSRLRSMAGKRGARCETCLEAIEGKPNWDVPALLGEQQTVAVFGAVTASLVDGTGHWLASVLEQQGVSRAWSSQLGALVEQHTAGTLFRATPDELPAGFQRLLTRVHLPLEQA